MSEGNDQNGQASAPVRVKFDTGNDKDIPLSWAEAMLIAWRQKAPAAFGKALAEAAIGPEKAS